MANHDFFDDICERFSIESLNPFQRKALSALRNGQDVFVGAKTGSGKSLVYESVPILFGERSTVVILCPLLTIMKEQAQRLNKLGFSAVQITDGCNKESVRNGEYQFIFGSPESLVKNAEWRAVFANSTFQTHLKLLVVDEAHTVTQWGEGKHGEKAFREAFGEIGQLRSLCLKTQVLALTATASPMQRRQIMKKLCFKPNFTAIVDSPDRENIKISVQNVKSSALAEDVFEWLIQMLKTDGKECPRHIIFCNSIKDCSKIYVAFKSKLGSSAHYDMYHSKTVDAVKEKIRQDMGKNGDIRVLICTDAAGMGVNFAELHNVIHFGPPFEMDTLVQQMGRAGRDNQPSHELIIFKASSLKKTDEDVLKVMKTDKCRRQVINHAYMNTNSKEIVKHSCCDNCEVECKCEGVNCPDTHPSKNKAVSDETEKPVNELKRTVTEDERELIRNRIDTLRSSFLNTQYIVDVDIVYGLTEESINQIVSNVEFLFTINDILEMSCLWSYSIASKVMNIIDDVFDDAEMYRIADVNDTDSD